jgi:hypothetical protein
VIVHDLLCPKCSCEMRNVPIEHGEYPSCDLCGTKMRWKPSRFRTDVYGAPRYSEAAGCEVRSSRDRDRIMREAGFFPCGDKVGGARNESHLGLGKITSYPGQSVRRVLTRER